MLASFCACSTTEMVDDNNTPTPSPTETVQPVPTEEAVSSINLEAGYRDDRITLSNGQALSFKISVPELEEGEKVPLIIALHWAGDDQTYKEFMDCLVQPAMRQTKAIIFGPAGGNSVWWSPISENILVTFINLVKEQWPIESDKVAVIGYSNGGISSWYFAANHPDIISASVPMAGVYEDVEKIDIPTYVIHGQNDELFSHSTNKGIVEQIKERGSDITFVTAEGLSHFEACNYTNYLSDAADWLVNEAWE